MDKSLRLLRLFLFYLLIHNNHAYHLKFLVSLRLVLQFLPCLLEVVEIRFLVMLRHLRNFLLWITHILYLNIFFSFVLLLIVFLGFLLNLLMVFLLLNMLIVVLIRMLVMSNLICYFLYSCLIQSFVLLF